MPTTVLVDLAGTPARNGSPPPGMVDAVAALREFDDATGTPIAMAYTGAAAAILGDTPRATTLADVGRVTGSAPGDTIAVTADATRAADARGRGMRVVHIGDDVAGWADVPRAIARIVDPDDVEARTFEGSLRTQGQITGEPGAAPSATHHRDADGHLERDRFRAI